MSRRAAAGPQLHAESPPGAAAAAGHEQEETVPVRQTGERAEPQPAEGVRRLAAPGGRIEFCSGLRINSPPQDQPASPQREGGGAAPHRPAPGWQPQPPLAYKSLPDLQQVQDTIPLIEGIVFPPGAGPHAGGLPDRPLPRRV